MKLFSTARWLSYKPAIPLAFNLAVCHLVSSATAQADCAVGVNVNRFQNFNAQEQETIVAQLKENHVRCVRTSLRLDQKNINLAKRLQSEGIGLVMIPVLKFHPGVLPRPVDEARHVRESMPLSAADVQLSRQFYQEVFDKLDANGIVLTGLELGNELNWADFNGDFPVPGQGKSFNFADLSLDPEAKQVARGFLQYLKVLQALKEVRDNSKLNKNTPLISAGMAACTGTSCQAQHRMDGVSIPATYRFLRVHGLDELVDGYGVHCSPRPVNGNDQAAVAARNDEFDRTVFVPGNKPYWVTEWAITSTAGSSEQDKVRARTVAEYRAYLRRLNKEGRLGGIFYYVWNEPDRASIYRNNTLMEAGQRAIAPL